MRGWDLTVAFDASPQRPLFVQLASAIEHDIRRGRLKPGDALPGTRELAERLGVNRNTIVAAYEELGAEALVTTKAGGGTFVAAAPALREAFPSHDSAPGAPRAIESPTYALRPTTLPPYASATPVPGALSFLSVPDVRAFPDRALARAFRRAIGPRSRALLAQNGPAGHVRLRRELAQMLARTRGLGVGEDDVVVTRSIEQGLDLVARTLLAPGDTVAVEGFGYPPAWNVLRLAGARLVPVPLDADGLDVDALEALLAREPIRAVFTTPHHQFPTASVMSAARRERLAALALRHRFAIIEDDYDHEFHYAGKPILPIAAGAGRANVVYVGALSNLLAPGISTAFVAAPAAIAERIVGLRGASDSRGDVAIECAIAELFEDGEFHRHVRRMRRVYAQRRDVLATALARDLGGALEFRVPDGGMAIWARVDGAIDLAAWSRAALREGVALGDTRACDFAQRDPRHLRLGFTYLDEREIEDGVHRLARALTRVRTSAIALATREREAAAALAEPPRERSFAAPLAAAASEHV